MKHYLIVDEDTTAAMQLSGLLEEHPCIETVHTAVHPYQVRSILKNLPIDTVFIRISQWDPAYFASFVSPPRIVFLASEKERMASDMQPDLEYQLVAPYKLPAVQKLLRKMESVTENATDRNNTDFFFIKFERRYHRIEFSTVELIEKKQNGYSLIFTPKYNYLVKVSIEDWMERLPKEQFLKPADNIIVPMQEKENIQDGNRYVFRNRLIALSFRFAKAARQEIHGLHEMHERMELT